MKTLKRLVVDIETNRQRLHHAILTRNEELTMRINHLLIELLASYFDLTKGDRMNNIERFYLVFSELNQDGVRVSASEYRQMLKTMDAMDRETHQAIEIAVGAESFADAMLEELKTATQVSVSKKKRGA
jgi:uncharacterized protein YbcC (UPF0753/DUF2309 family)